MKQEYNDQEWCKTHTLSQEQFKKLLEAKLKRAQQMYHALNKREIETKIFDR